LLDIIIKELLKAHHFQTYTTLTRISIFLYQKKQTCIKQFKSQTRYLRRYPVEVHLYTTERKQVFIKGKKGKRENGGKRKTEEKE